ncbi:MAG: S8 family serine peptidase [Bacteroidales bacterium]|nr:S8 family serine peptidase [Bacteroidales bacterium]
MNRLNSLLHISIVFAAALTVASCSNNIQAPESIAAASDENKTFVSGSAIVRLSEDAANAIENGGSLNSSLEITSLTRLFPDAGEFESRTRAEGMHLWYRINYNPEIAYTKAAGDISTIDGVEFVEPDRIVKLTDSFNDPKLPQMWSLKGNTGGYSGINVEPVWQNYTVGSSEVIVAVIDGGIQMDHEDLAGAVIPGGNDGSKNFVDGGFYITPDLHGTHVAGTIGAISNNGIGVAGIAGGDAAKGIAGVRLLSCQFLKDDSDKGSGDTAAAIKWAADHGATICNNSWGYSYDANNDGALTGDELERALNARITQADKAAVDYFIKYAGFDASGNQTGPMAGGVVFFAAGNENIANGAPANYEPIVAVGATDVNFNKANFSNYGDWVDICAPGTQILSTAPGNSYRNLQGTSMACPHVTGVAALIISYFGGKGFTNSQLIDKLLRGANQNAVHASAKIGPFLDAMGAFTCDSPGAPAKVSGIVSGASANRMDFTFAVPGEENGTPAYQYMIAASKDKSKIENFDPFSAVPEGVITAIVSNNATPTGAQITISLPDLEFSSRYYAVILAANYNGNYSEPSDVVEQATYENNPPVFEFIDAGPYVIKASEVRKIRIKVTDPDSHSINFSFDGGSEAADYSYSAEDSVLTVELRGKKAPEGNYKLSVTATDKYGATASTGFDYTILPNQPPVVSKEPEDILSYGKSQSITLNLSEYFTDPEEEEMEFRVRGYNVSLVNVNVAGSQLTITPKAFGLSSIMLVAVDAGGKEGTTPVNILVKDPDNVAESFPNPVIDKLTIRTEEETQTTIRIIGESGAKVYENTLNVGGFAPAEIDMTACAPGKYRLYIAYSGKEFSRIITKK